MILWYEHLSGLFAHSWHHLTRPHTRVTLGTIDQNVPQLRMVVLRHADVNARSITIHTDATTPKVAQIKANPQTSLLYWDDQDQLQIRLSGLATMRSGDAAADIWADLPDFNRQNYGVTPPPGSDIPSSDAYKRAPNPQQFCEITITTQNLDIVHLSPDHHRRAKFDASNNWQGQWVAP